MAVAAAAAAARLVPVPLRRSAPERDVEPAQPAWAIARSLVSRRGLFGLTAGGVAGIVLGRGLRPAPPIEAGADVGVIYHQWSKPGIIDALGSLANWGQPVALYKRYPEADIVGLPRPDTEVVCGQPRRSRVGVDPRLRRHADDAGRAVTTPLPDEWHRHGHVRQRATDGALIGGALSDRGLRGRPSRRGHRTRRAAATPASIWLEQVRSGDYRAKIVEQGISQQFLGRCGVVLFLTMILQRMRPKYQDRSYRYGLLEAGHLGENAYLAATSMGLGACGIGAFMDDAINEMLGVDGVEEAAVYMLAAGRIADAAESQPGILHRPFAQTGRPAAAPPASPQTPGGVALDRLAVSPDDVPLVVEALPVGIAGRGVIGEVIERVLAVLDLLGAVRSIDDSDLRGLGPVPAVTDAASAAVSAGGPPRSRRSRSAFRPRLA